MKKNFLFVLIFFFVQNLNSQTILYEDFSNASMPPDGWQISSHSNNWSISETHYAEGQSPEVKLSWTPQFNDSTKLISPPLDLTSLDRPIYVYFRHYVDDYSGGYTLKLQVYTPNDGWKTFWSKQVNSSVSAELIIAQMPQLQDSSAVQFALTFYGNSYNLNYWYIDDINVFASADIDLALYKIDHPYYILNGENINFPITLLNQGQENITQFTINCSNGIQTFSENISGVNIAPLEFYNYTFTQAYQVLRGKNNITIWISNINGSVDSISNNDTMNFIIVGASNFTNNVPLYEEFTSSTCGPCASFNSNIFNPFLASHPDVTCIKYQMYWPGSGDPYYTEEGGVRQQYYGVTYVPWLVAGGYKCASSSSAVNQSYNDLTAKKAFVELNAFYQIDGNNVNISVELMPFIDLENATMQIAVVEDTTTQNTGNNGETEFYHVMMKMVPDAYGTILNLRDSVKQTFYFSQDMTNTNVEEMDDLSVVVFIQYDQNMEVLQSCWAQQDIPQPVIAYNIAENDTIGLFDTIIATFNTPVRFINDQEINNDNATTIFTLKSNTENIPFTVEVNNEKTRFAIIPTNGLPNASTILLSIANQTIENFQDEPFAGDTLVFFTTNPSYIIQAKSVKLFPNPADEFINIYDAQNSKFYLFTLEGKLIRQGIIKQKKYKLSLNNLNVGVYYLTIVNNSKRKQFKIIKK